LQVLAAGFLVADVIAADLPKVSDPGEVTFAPIGIRLAIGGHPANVSVDLLQLGIAQGEVGLVGAVGTDVFGDFMEKALRERGVITHLKRVPGVGTTSDAILVVKGEDRRFHVDLGASWYFDPDELLSVLRREKPSLLYIAAGICGRLDDRLAEVLEEGKRLGCVTFADLATPYGKGWDFIREPLKWTDIFHCNDAEAMNITGAKTLSEAKNGLVAMGAKMVFVTLGTKGATLQDSRGFSMEQAPFRVDTVDPTGAGDAFCAGIITEMIRGNLLGKLASGLDLESMKHLLIVGQATGAVCTTGVGATATVTRENLDRLLADQGKGVEAGTRIHRGREA
jgi:sugar/nucleoside kinase (ribokinase family)